MITMRLFRYITVFGAIFASIAISRLKQSPGSPQEELLVSNTYLGPKTSSGKLQLVRVEVSVQDSPEINGLQITSVEFNNQNIPLQPRDIYGNRGTASFQLLPGTYKLVWTVNRARFAWPRTIKHEEIVTINPRDLWLQVSIVGETASVL